MAEFCNHCATRLSKIPGGEGVKTSIDVFKTYDALEADTYLPIGICEGCGLTHVGNIKGELKVMTMSSDWKDYPLHWDDWEGHVKPNGKPPKEPKND